jgi:hypothetical protein
VIVAATTGWQWWWGWQHFALAQALSLSALASGVGCRLGAAVVLAWSIEHLLERELGLPGSVSGLLPLASQRS